MLKKLLIIPCMVPLLGFAPMSVTIEVDGKKISSVDTGNVAEILDKHDIELNYEDRVEREPGKITVSRMETKIEKTETDIPRPVREEQDPSLDEGVRQVIEEGSDGKKTVSVSVTYENGEKVSEEPFMETEIPAVEQVVKVGTKKKTVAQPSLPSPLAPAIPVSDVQAYARNQVLARGWTEEDFSALVRLWQRESGWNYQSVNRSSGACGIPQALPCGKMSSAGADYATNPETQVNWGLTYIAHRYGSPLGAWNAFLSKGWY